MTFSRCLHCLGGSEPMHHFGVLLLASIWVALWRLLPCVPQRRREARQWRPQYLVTFDAPRSSRRTRVAEGRQARAPGLELSFTHSSSLRRCRRRGGKSSASERIQYSVERSLVSAVCGRL